MKSDQICVSKIRYEGDCTGFEQYGAAPCEKGVCQTKGRGAICSGLQEEKDEINDVIDGMIKEIMSRPRAGARRGTPLRGAHAGESGTPHAGPQKRKGRGKWWHSDSPENSKTIPKI